MRPLVDGDALDLVEHGRVGGVEFVAAVHATGRHDVDRQLAAEQRPHLHRGGVGAHDEVLLDRLDEERVLRGTSRVVLIEVQRVEVEPLVLELRSFRDLPAHGDEDVGHLLHQQGERMPRSRGPACGEGGDIHRLGDQPRGLFLRHDLGFPSRERLRDPTARLPHQLACGGLLVGGDVAQLRVQLRERRRLTQVGGADLLQRGGVRCRRDRRERSVNGRGYGLVGDESLF